MMPKAPPCYDDLDEGTPLLGKGEVKQVLGLRRSSLLLSLFLMFYIVYLVFGGLVFAIIEGPVEAALREEVAAAQNDFLARNPSVKDAELEELIEKIVAASNRGVSATRNASGEPNWSFGQSLFFSSTVITTIGYGHVTPLSKVGKCFCIGYAIFGIPLTLMLLTMWVERLMIPSTHLLHYLNSKLGHLYQPFNIRLLHLFFVFTVFLVFFLFIPAGAFASLEPEWDFLDSLYYCFISVTTIGLGDYIPGDSPNQPYRPLYKVLTTGYLLCGLTFMVFLLTVFYDIPQLNFGLFFLMQSDEATDNTLDPEKVRLQTSGPALPKYTGQLTPDSRHSIVRVKSRRDDSPSPEDTTPVHAMQ